jgi:hypothetical protein
MPQPLFINGTKRTAQNLDTVDHIEDTDEKSHPAATPKYPTQMKPSPSSYAPSGDSGPRVYGNAPVSDPILSGGK